MDKEAFRKQYGIARQLYHCRDVTANWGSIIDPRVLRSICPKADRLDGCNPQSRLSCERFSYGN